jgi:UDP-N-acetylglucosamine:LPS N-acetylglucosamine transferase
VELLGLCGDAYPILTKKIPDLQMVCVCGESYGHLLPNLPAGIELHPYIDRLYEHYAACDMAVVVGGGTTTIELAALRKPFAFFPLQNQFDQQVYISGRLERQGAGIRMNYRDTSAIELAEVILKHIGTEVTWPTVPANGAENAARIIAESLP